MPKITKQLRLLNGTSVKIAYEGSECDIMIS